MRCWICIFCMLSFNTCVVYCYYVGTHATKAILNNCLTCTYLLYIHLPLTEKDLKTKLTWNTCNLSSLCYLFTSWKLVDIFSFNFWQQIVKLPHPTCQLKKLSKTKLTRNKCKYIFLQFVIVFIHENKWVKLGFSCFLFSFY